MKRLATPLSLLLLLEVLIGAALSTDSVGALFTDTASVPGNTFTTAAVFSPPWWDASYGYRQRITVTTGPNSPFNGYDGYSVQLLTDTASLIGAGNLQADCDDLRVVFWNLSLWTELDRDLYSCNAASTEVWFQLQADIAPNSTDSRYYLYYGNPAAAGPPANRSNVYLHYNDWSTDRLAEYDIGRQDSWHGTGTYTGFTWDSINQRVNFDTGDNFTGGLRLASFGERDVYIEQTVRYTGCYPSNVTQGPMARYSGDGTSSDNWYAFVQANTTGCTPGAYTNPAMQKDSRASSGFCGSGSGTPWALDGTTHRQGFAAWGINSTNLKGWLDKTARRPTEAADLSCSDASDHENTGDVAWMQAQSAGSFDDFLVRRYTEPEPTMSLAAEETTVALLGSWTTGLTHTVGSGSNRLLVFIAGMENGMAAASPPAGDRDLTAVTYGGQSLTPAQEVVVCSGSPNSFCARTELWYLDEAGIQAATGSTFSPTWSGDPPYELEEYYTAVTLKNVDQSSPIGNSSTNGTTTANPIQTSSALLVGAGDLVVVSAFAGNAGSYTPGSGYTEGTDQSALSATMASAYKTIAADGTEQPSMQFDLTINRQVILAAAIKVAP